MFIFYYFSNQNIRQVNQIKLSVSINKKKNENILSWLLLVCLSFLYVIAVGFRVTLTHVPNTGSSSSQPETTSTTTTANTSSTTTTTPSTNTENNWNHLSHTWCLIFPPSEYQNNRKKNRFDHFNIRYLFESIFI